MTKGDIIFNVDCVDELDKVVVSAIAFHLVLMKCKNCLVSTSEFFFNFNSALNVYCWLLFWGIYARIVAFKNVFSRVPTSTIMILCFLFAFYLVSQICIPRVFLTLILGALWNSGFYLA